MELMLINLCINNNPIPETGFYSFVEEHDALISSSIIILLFIFERIYTIRSNQKQTKREWYVNTIINPNLKSISNFYYECIRISKTNKDKNVSGLTVDSFNTIVKETTMEFKELKKDFDYEFIELVRSVSPQRAKSLRDCVSELDDTIISTFHTSNKDTIDIDKLIKEINSNKAKFFKELFEEIKNN